MAPWRHGRIYLGGRRHEPSAGALKLPAGDNSAYLARWAAALARAEVRGRKTKRGLKISRRGINPTRYQIAGRRRGAGLTNRRGKRTRILSSQTPGCQSTATREKVWEHFLEKS